MGFAPEPRARQSPATPVTVQRQITALRHLPALRQCIGSLRCGRSQVRSRSALVYLEHSVGTADCEFHSATHSPPRLSVRPFRADGQCVACTDCPCGAPNCDHGVFGQARPNRWAWARAGGASIVGSAIATVASITRIISYLGGPLADAADRAGPAFPTRRSEQSHACISRAGTAGCMRSTDTPGGAWH